MSNLATATKADFPLLGREGVRQAASSTSTPPTPPRSPVTVVIDAMSDYYQQDVNANVHRGSPTSSR